MTEKFYNVVDELSAYAGTVDPRRLNVREFVEPYELSDGETEYLMERWDIWLDEIEPYLNSKLPDELFEI